MLFEENVRIWEPTLKTRFGIGSGSVIRYWSVEVPSMRAPFDFKTTGVPDIKVVASPGAIDCPSNRIPRDCDTACITCPCIVVKKA